MIRAGLAVLTLLLLSPTAQADDDVLYLTFRNQTAGEVRVKIEDVPLCTLAPGKKCSWSNGRMQDRAATLRVRIEKADGKYWDGYASRAKVWPAADAGNTRAPCQMLGGFYMEFAVTEQQVEPACPSAVDMF